jgi:hypothetical protein
VVPGRVDHLAALEMEVGDGPGREDADRVSPLEVAQRLPHARDVPTGGGVPLEGVDEHEHLVKLGDAGEEVAGEDLGVRAPPPQEVGEDQALDPPERMVRHDDDRALRRDPLDVPGGDLVVHLHRPEACPPELLILGEHHRVMVDIRELVQPRAALEHGHEPTQRRVQPPASLPELLAQRSFTFLEPGSLGTAGSESFAPGERVGAPRDPCKRSS